MPVRSVGSLALLGSLPNLEDPARRLAMDQAAAGQIVRKRERNFSSIEESVAAGQLLVGSSVGRETSCERRYPAHSIFLCCCLGYLLFVSAAQLLKKCHHVHSQLISFHTSLQCGSG